MRRLRNKIARLGPRLRASDVFKGGATALAIKFAGAILNFAMLALLSRQIDPDAFGSFAIIFSALGFLAALAPCGQEVLISRSWGEYVSSNRPGLARGVLTFGIQVVCTAVLLAAAAVAIIWPQLDRTLSISLVFAACSFLIAQALMHFSGQFSRVAAGVLIGDGPREIIWRGIVVTVILAHQAMGAAFSATEFFFVAATGLALGIIVQIRKVSRFVPEAVKRTKPQRDVSAWIPCSLKMWLSALSDIAAQYLEVVVVGLFLGPAVAGFYFVATRITNVFAMMAAGTSMYAGSVISKLYFSDAKVELQGILNSLALMSANTACWAPRWHGASRPSPWRWRSPSPPVASSGSTPLREQPSPTGPLRASASKEASHDDPLRRRSACRGRARPEPRPRGRNRAKGQNRSRADTG